MNIKSTCPDCGVTMGEPHRSECDIEWTTVRKEDMSQSQDRYEGDGFIILCSGITESDSEIELKPEPILDLEKSSAAFLSGKFPLANLFHDR